MSSVASTATRIVPGGVAVALALASVYIVWGSTYLGIRFALEGGWPPLLMAGGRFVVAGALMYAALRLRGERPPTRAQWASLAVMGLLLMGLGNGLVTVAEQWVSSGLAAIAVASMPLWMGLFATLRGERPGREEWIGLAIGFVGVLWLNAGSALTATPQGLLALLIAPIAWAFGSVWSRGRDLPSPFMSAAGQMLCGGAMMLVAGALLGERMPAAPSLKGTLAVAYLVVFGSIVAFSAYIWLLRHVRPALASSYAYVNPPIAVLFGALLAGERFSLHALGAMAVILAGVAMVTLARSRPRAPVAEPVA
ncbi:drug/metabolite exporter YedA [Marilutibacter chinensis]|uniref:Drug/metabolite exporter YedA n=1 Tax=Marilutibacter chinensis TaxID=2912247 RepID=A0ABS9HSI0_9GAMM|nr:drug/metabolite exporter YedA [Lysobacter chinensis]MCF7221471.1 drug/metabolite exporter YedA [Lysobacter chinensis]